MSRAMARSQRFKWRTALFNSARSTKSPASFAALECPGAAARQEQHAGTALREAASTPAGKLW